VSFIRHENLSEEEYPPFRKVRSQFGFVPNLFRAQLARKDLLEAQMGLSASATETGALGRQQKEYIFLAVSARNLNTYCVTAHCEIVRMLKIEGPEPEQVAIDHTMTKLPLRDKALINFAIKLNETPTEITQADIDALRTFGFTDAQILEAIVMTGTAQFANMLSFALGTVPDFHNERAAEAISAHAPARA